MRVYVRVSVLFVCVGVGVSDCVRVRERVCVRACVKACECVRVCECGGVCVSECV